MNYSEAFNIFKDHCSAEVAMLACTVGAIHMAIDPTEEDFINQGVFSDKLMTKWKGTLFEEDSEDVTIAIKLWLAFCDFDQTQSLAGLGGCVARPFDVIYNDSKTYEGWAL